MTNTEPVIRLIDRLNNLGSADTIARFFNVNNISGLPGDPAYCPVTKYVRAKTSLPVCTSPSFADYPADGRVLVWNLDDNLNLRAGNVAAFMSNFDNEYYPDVLDDEEWPPVAWDD